MGGAASRLLPASVPLRWFGAAVLCHALAWAALGAAAGELPHWPGGLGWPLAALHLATVGTLLASAIGASLQLLPVATRQPVKWAGLAATMWWLFVPGVALLTLGMGGARPMWLAAGAAAVLSVLLAWAVLLAANLVGARGMPGVVLHGWGALVALVLLTTSAAVLVALWLGHPLPGAPGRDAARMLHAAAGILGVMGLLVLGLAAILLPMFALASVPAERPQLAAAGCAIAAMALWMGAALVPAGAGPTLVPGGAGPTLAPGGAGPALAAVVAWPAFALRAAAWLAAALALTLHLHMMRRVLRSGMRPDLGRAGLLMRVGWGAAVFTLGVGAAWLALEAGGGDAAWRERLGRLFMLAAIAGWLLSFLFGVLQRILPFLAAMHAARERPRALTPLALTHEPALAWHARCHITALALLGAAVLADSPGLWRLAAGVGGLGALAFMVFFAVLVRRLRRATPAAPTPPTT